MGDCKDGLYLSSGVFDHASANHGWTVFVGLVTTTYGLPSENKNIENDSIIESSYY